MILFVDDFFKDPYKVRSIALKQKYSNEKYNFPGIRSLCISEDINKYILSQIRDYTKNPNLKIRESSFQSIGKDFLEGMFHSDKAFADYTAVLFLSLNPPLNSGTEICDSIEGVHTLMETPVKPIFYKNPKHFLNAYNYDRIRRRLNGLYNPISKIPSKFNRLVLFDSSLIHRAQKFYGTSVANSRLTLVLFFEKK